ncbi:hypothetical protein LshimejAT787_0409850 [Lyophyllum shimeji]|uniref:Uncharacterized protein n=1 Tax=Lyophyllum shimeji TaxID=47721 RepID=A0A9P3PM34_LYOSH|nr:hypothetical protein LshimejAT787_0409850 [Lyophyllum shimeji]
MNSLSSAPRLIPEINFANYPDTNYHAFLVHTGHANTAVPRHTSTQPSPGPSRDTNPYNHNRGPSPFSSSPRHVEVEPAWKMRGGEIVFDRHAQIQEVDSNAGTADLEALEFREASLPPDTTPPPPPKPHLASLAPSSLGPSAQNSPRLGDIFLGPPTVPNSPTISQSGSPWPPLSRRPTETNISDSMSLLGQAPAEPRPVLDQAAAAARLADVLDQPHRRAFSPFRRLGKPNSLTSSGRLPLPSGQPRTKRGPSLLSRSTTPTAWNINPLSTLDINLAPSVATSPVLGRPPSVSPPDTEGGPHQAQTNPQPPPQERQSSSRRKSELQRMPTPRQPSGLGLNLRRLSPPSPPSPPSPGPFRYQAPTPKDRTPSPPPSHPIAYSARFPPHPLPSGIDRPQNASMAWQGAASPNHFESPYEGYAANPGQPSSVPWRLGAFQGLPQADASGPRHASHAWHAMPRSEAASPRASYTPFSPFPDQPQFSAPPQHYPVMSEGNIQGSAPFPQFPQPQPPIAIHQQSPGRRSPQTRKEQSRAEMPQNAKGKQPESFAPSLGAPRFQSTPPRYQHRPGNMRPRSTTPPEDARGLLETNLRHLEFALGDVDGLTAYFGRANQVHDVNAHAMMSGRVRAGLHSLMDVLARQRSLLLEQLQVGTRRWHEKNVERLSSLWRTIHSFGRFVHTISGRDPTISTLAKALAKLGDFESKLSNLASKFNSLLNRLRVRQLHSMLSRAHIEAHEQLVKARSKRDLPGWEDGKRYRAELRRDWIRTVCKLFPSEFCPPNSIIDDQLQGVTIGNRIT